MLERSPLNSFQSNELDRQTSVEPGQFLSRRRRDIAIAITGIGVAGAIISGALITSLASAEADDQTIIKTIDSYGPPASTHPLGKPLAAPEGKGGYKFLNIQPHDKSQPVRWNPCKPIHYVINPVGAPTGGAEAINKAVNTISNVTGLKFAYDGTTNENAIKDRPTVNESLYGKGWSPVLVDWVSPKDYPAMAGFAGLGGPDIVGTSDDNRKDISGVVLLNQDYLAEAAHWQDGQIREDAVVLHEFGHLVGLDHIDDPMQLMYKQPSTNGLGPGDIRGLVLLGSGGCL